METKYTVGKNEYKRMTTEELRDTFLINNLFKAGEVVLNYCEIERSVVGSAVPTSSSLKLEAGKQFAADYFCQRREAGVLNIGNTGTVTVDGTDYTLENQDCLYIGRGSKEITFSSSDAQAPAQFYIVSYPAHTAYPTKHASKASANPLHLGSLEDANKRTIYQYIYEGGIESCQLVMGVTSLEEGSVWNTMPAHTHERRTEVYMYFEVQESAAVFHMMGPPDETRHILLGNGDAVISPMWSIHSGCGTRNYTFCWAMGGENQAFNDMDGVAVPDLR